MCADLIWTCDNVLNTYNTLDLTPEVLQFGSILLQTAAVTLQAANRRRKQRRNRVQMVSTHRKKKCHTVHSDV